MYNDGLIHDIARFRVRGFNGNRYIRVLDIKRKKVIAAIIVNGAKNIDRNDIRIVSLKYEEIHENKYESDIEYYFIIDRKRYYFKDYAAFKKADELLRRSYQLTLLT